VFYIGALFTVVLNNVQSLTVKMQQSAARLSCSWDAT